MASTPGTRPVDGSAPARSLRLVLDARGCPSSSAACSARPLSFHVLSIAFVLFTAPAGVALGFFLGWPVALVIARWLSRRTIGPDPTHVVRTLQVVGAAIALVINGSTNLWLGLYSWDSPSLTDLDALASILAFAVPMLLCILASGFVGWTCGATLAQAYLVKTGHASALERMRARVLHPWR